MTADVEHLLVAAVRDFLRARNVNGGVAVAVSGGADSVALLAACQALGVSPLLAVHVHHGLRGAEADADAAFVSGLAGRLGVPCVIERADVQSASGGRNVEATARRLRYERLNTAARSAGLATIATGHTADDQAETVLHRVLRGGGIAALAGIRPVRRVGGVTVVRPILRVPRAAVLDYLRCQGLTYRDDSTNADVRFTRNRIRHELLPKLLLEYNPRLIERFCHLAEQAAEARRTLSREAMRLLRAAEFPRAGSLCVFDEARLGRASRPELRAMWRQLWRRERWPSGEMGFREWDRLAGLSHGDVAAVDLPGGIRARRAGRVVRAGPGA